MPMKQMLAAAIFATMGATTAQAVPNLVASERTDTNAFVGVSIPLSPVPQLRVTVGLRQVTVGSGGDVSGSEVGLGFDPRTLGNVQLRAAVLRGSVDRLGKIGAGWDLTSAKPFVTLGVAMPHMSAGADIGFEGAMPQFSLGFDSLSQIDAPDLEPAPDSCPVFVPTFSTLAC